jgi:hypothetical protein
LTDFPVVLKTYIIDETHFSTVATYEDLSKGEKHAVVLYNTPIGVLESCDSSPFKRMTELVELGDEDRLWHPRVLIYNGNCSE